MNAAAARDRAIITGYRGPKVRIMEVCGTHTHEIFRLGIRSLLPENVELISGPGCPVCVTPVSYIDEALYLAEKCHATICTFGDLVRVPGTAGTLAEARSRGARVQVVYTPLDAVTYAAEHPEEETVFLSVGFETTTPPTAVAIKQAAALGLKNFSVLCCHVLTPSAISSILESPEVRQWGTVPLDGFIGPAHVSTVIGSRPYARFAAAYKKPVVIAGFEPLDVMQAILMLVRQVNDGRAEVENEFTRAVTDDGNLKAQALMADVFALRESFEWRGLGVLPRSALRIHERYAAFDAEARFGLVYVPVADHKACECGPILRGVKAPLDCKLFGTVCTPETPMGACMVSSEGACAAHYNYGRFRDHAATL